MTFSKAILPLIALLGASASPLAAEEVRTEAEIINLDPDPSYEALIFRGGLVIAPGEDGARDIGGISGLEWHGDALYAISDDGNWLIITPDEVGGKLIDLFSVEQGRLLDPRGRRPGRQQRNAEAITRDANGEWLVSFELEDRVWRYADIDGDASESDLPITDLITAAQALDNSGLETLTATPDGILACGEWTNGATPNCVRSMGDQAEAFELTPPPALVEHGAAPTDASCASDGTCYVLFRSYQPGYGNRIAIMELSPDNQASALASFAPPLAIDNFEGLAVREDRGKTYLYLISDDNLNNCAYRGSGSCQRTLLYKFEIASEEPIESGAPQPGSVPVTEPEQNYETVSVVLETALGNITIALETERAPITAANFLRYVDEDRLDGTAFYRAMRLDREPLPNGLVQGGARWDPERVLPGIPHEPTNVTGLSHTSGALSMAMGEPGTANGDFSIMVRDQIGLDARPDAEDPVWQHGYAVFGYVTHGMDVVEAIHGAPIDPNLGEGWMVGQMLADPVVIIDARRAPVEEAPEASQATDAPPAP